VQGRATPPTAPPGVPLLRQRVPGAQLPEGVNPGVVEAPPVADPEAARALVEEFEAGVRRAQNQASEVPEAPAPIAPPPPGPRGPLSRRVPGATLSTSLPPKRVNQPAPAQWAPDPDAARDLMEQFESGVVRALRDAETDPRHEEGSQR
jgi:hypothetical protein